MIIGVITFPLILNIYTKFHLILRGCSVINKGSLGDLTWNDPALYTHCYGHALNLACSDADKKCKITRDGLDSSYELIKLVKKSPRWDAMLQKLKQQMLDDSPGIRVLCPTRWTVRAA